MNPFDFFDKIFCINLDSRPDRWEEAQKEFEKACIQDRVERFPGIVVPGNPDKGAHLSHAGCIRLAKEQGCRNVLILEDDIEWLANPLELKRVVPEVPENWDMLYLGVNTERELYQISFHLAKLTFAFSTHAYAVNSSMYDKLIELNEREGLGHNDVAITCEIIPYHNCLATIPLLAGQRKSFSNILQRDMESNPVFRERFYQNLVYKNLGSLDLTFVTFIVPTLGRATVQRTIDSFVAQPDWNWKAIIMGDGVKPNTDYQDDLHVKIMQCEHKSHAGLVRNEAMRFVTTDWIAFCDDDDWLDSNYVSSLKIHAEAHPDCDIIIFSYRDVVTGNIQPPKGSGEEFYYCNVGISYAVKTDFVIRSGAKFDPYATEDFGFLDYCRNHGAKYIVTHDIKYYVGGIGGWRA